MHPEHPEGFDDALGASYRLISKLGEGATGEVWSTEHRRTGETVATKLLRPEHLADRVLVRRFFEERDVLTGLRHHGVVSVRDLVAEGDRLAIVMEYVDGGSLRDVLRARGPLPPALAVAVTAAVLDGLAAAHTQGVVHRDIKPDNVLLTREWWSLRPGDVKLVDFGISRILTEGSRGTTGSMLGTPEYMAPELMTRGVAERPADLYGVGIMLYELLAGRTPFSGPGNDYTVAHRHVSSQPPPLALPAPLDEVLQSLLAKDPDARPGAATAAEVLRRIGGELTGLPALPRQDAPAEFEEARGPVTLLKGFSDATVPRAPVLPDLSTPEGAASQGTDFDLGVPSQVTTLRPFLTPPRPITPADVAPPPEAPRPGWKDPRLITLVAACLVLIVGAGLFVTLKPGGSGGEANAAGDTPGEAAGPVSSQLPVGQELPTGLRVQPAATYDPAEQTIELTVTYAAGDAPLTGPFLQVVPGTVDGTTCPFDVDWTVDGTAPVLENEPSSTGLVAECGWAVDVGTIESGETATATATVSQELEGDDPQTSLDEWLAATASLTDEALAQPISGPAYPVQRLEGLTVSTTDRTVADGTPLQIKILPVWAGGVEDPEPIYRSPAEGAAPTQVLQQIAGPDAVRFTDQCGSNLVISGQGTVVSPRAPYEDCIVGARVGNFSDLESNEFAITTRGS